MTLNKTLNTFVLTSWPQTSSWSWTWPFQQEDGKKREGRGGILHPNPLSPSRPDLTWPFTPDCITLSPTPDLDPDWRGLVLRQTGTCFSGRTWTFPPNATDSCSMYYNGDSPWGRSLSVVAFFFFASQDMGLNFGTRLWRRRKSRGTAPTSWTVTGFIVKSIVLNKQRKPTWSNRPVAVFQKLLKTQQWGTRLPWVTCVFLTVNTLWFHTPWWKTIEKSCHSQTRVKLIKSISISLWQVSYHRWPHGSD